MIATGNFQTMITEPSKTDNEVVVLWSRLGSLMPQEEFKGAISGGAVTGTEWEFEDAVHGYQKHKKPHLLLYRKAAEVVASLDDKDVLENKLKKRKL